MSLYDRLENPIENFRILTLSCHSQTIAMAAIVLFTEMLECHWHYDYALDSLYFTATSRVHLYVFFQYAFAVPIFSPFFDLVAPFLGIPLYLAYSATVPPYMAQPAAALP